MLDPSRREQRQGLCEPLAHGSRACTAQALRQSRLCRRTGSATGVGRDLESGQLRQLRCLRFARERFSRSIFLLRSALRTRGDADARCTVSISKLWCRLCAVHAEFSSAHSLMAFLRVDGEHYGQESEEEDCKEEREEERQEEVALLPANPVVRISFQTGQMLRHDGAFDGSPRWTFATARLQTGPNAGDGCIRSGFRWGMSKPPTGPRAGSPARSALR